MKNKTFENGDMTCRVVSIICHDMDDLTNNDAIIYIVNSHDFTVVHGLDIRENQGSWWFAYDYDITNLTDATILLLEKVK